MAHLQHQQQQQQQPSNEHFESELNFPSKKLHEIFRLKFKEKKNPRPQHGTNSFLSWVI